MLHTNSNKKKTTCCVKTQKNGSVPCIMLYYIKIDLRTKNSHNQWYLCFFLQLLMTELLLIINLN